MPGELWIDREDAEEAITHRCLTEEESANLRKFARDGYFITHIDLTELDASKIDADVNRLWREKPRDVAFAYDSPPLRFSTADQAAQRKPRYRIHDMHSVSAVARSLYVHPTLIRYASLILGEEAVATQSLYFEFGSQQPLHRDSIVVPTPVFGRLLASWIALEDIDPRSGALMYVPGSQKLPFYEFEPGQYMFDGRRMSADQAIAAMRFHDEESERRGLKPHLFEAKRGDVLIWHSALLHGGGAVGDSKLTRKSYVVHYSTLRQHPSREITVVDDGRESVYTTRKLIDGRGFDNPLNGELRRS
jgi:phytanoyl-CoA hydroxylase